MKDDLQMKILDEVLEMKAHIARIDEKLTTHCEWEEKRKYWLGSTILPVFLSGLVSFCVSIFK